MLSRRPCCHRQRRRVGRLHDNLCTAANPPSPGLFFRRETLAAATLFVDSGQVFGPMEKPIPRSCSPQGPKQNPSRNSTIRHHLPTASPPSQLFSASKCVSSSSCLSSSEFVGCGCRCGFQWRLVLLGKKKVLEVGDAFERICWCCWGRRRGWRWVMLLNESVDSMLDVISVFIAC